MTGGFAGRTGAEGGHRRLGCLHRENVGRQGMQRGRKKYIVLT